ncbi:MAG: hypothetical protein WAU07_04135 [Microgenomates group bacterium]
MIEGPTINRSLIQRVKSRERRAEQATQPYVPVDQPDKNANLNPQSKDWLLGTYPDFKTQTSGIPRENVDTLPTKVAGEVAPSENVQTGETFTEPNLAELQDSDLQGRDSDKITPPVDENASERNSWRPTVLGIEPGRPAVDMELARIDNDIASAEAEIKKLVASGRSEDLTRAQQLQANLTKVKALRKERG